MDPGRVDDAASPAVPAPPDDDLVALLRSLGASDHEIDTVDSSALGLDLRLRPRTDATFAHVAEDAGVEWAWVHRLLLAFGVPARPDDRATEAEADAVRLLVTVSRDLLGDESTFQLARVTGTTMARLADALVTAFRLRFELPRRDAGARNAEMLTANADLVQSLLPRFLDTLDVLLRRQIIEIARRLWSTDDERSAVTLTRTVGFVDLVGYTAAAATMSTKQLTEVLIAFDEKVAGVVQSGGGQVVKTIGDEAMFVTVDAAAACAIGLRLATELGAGGIPPVRVGVATGEVVSVLGDIYGPAVNLASRLVSAADPGSVVVDAGVRSAVTSGTFASTGPLSLKGIADAVEAFVLTGLETS